MPTYAPYSTVPKPAGFSSLMEEPLWAFVVPTGTEDVYKVAQVIVIATNTIQNNGRYWANSIGYGNSNGIWVETSYSSAYRGTYAGIGMYYSSANDQFSASTPITNSYNGHYYQVALKDITWDGALIEASQASYRGLYGYLLSIDDGGENAFIKTLDEVANNSSFAFWLALTDITQEGVWVKQAGPDKGKSASFFDWRPGEPNGSRVENYVILNVPWESSNRLAWNDYSGKNPSPNAYSFGYVIEYGGLAPSYKITPSKNSVDEGSDLTFTIDTKNIEWGKSVPYTLTGISQGDLSTGSLSGSAVVYQNGADGQATVTVSLASDKTTEGAEIVKLAIGSSISPAVTINDTSRTPIYNLTTSSTSINEGATITFYLTATDVSAGTVLDYAITGITAADLASGSLTGTVAVGSDGKSTMTFSILEDQLTEGDEKLTLTIQGKSATVTVKDSSLSLPPSYSITPSASVINEGSQLTFTIDTKNVENGKSIPYTMLGISQADLSAGAISGSVKVAQNGASGRAEVSVIIANDKTLEGIETVSLKVGSTTSPVVKINDTSVASGPIFNRTNGHYYDTALLIASVEDYTPKFTDGADFAKAIELAANSSYKGLYGYLATITSSLENSIVQKIIPVGWGQFYLGATDQNQEGTWKWVSGPETGEALNFSNWDSGEPNGGMRENALAINTKGAGKWNDTFNQYTYASSPPGYVIEYGGLPPSFSISTSANAVDEGKSISFTVLSRNVEWGSKISYSLVGISQGDIASGALTGSLTILQNGQDGKATLTVNVAADKLTEEVPESIQLKIGTSLSPTVAINDVSKTPLATYNLTSSASTINEGGALTFNLITTNVAPGTKIPYQISGISSADLVDGFLSGNFSVGSNGTATLRLLLASDQFTEGDETLTLTAQGKSISASVRDTSATPAFSVTASTPTVDEGGIAVFNVATTNVLPGTLASYTISTEGSNGIIFYVDSSDIEGGNLTGKVSVLSNGTAKISIPVLADKRTEGTEILVITVDGKSALMTVNDTSRGSALTTLSLVDSSPVQSQKRVMVSSDIVLTFSENIQLDTGTILLKDSSGNTVETFKSGLGNGLSTQGAQLRVNPAVDLKIFEQYSLVITQSSIKGETSLLQGSQEITFFSKTLDSLYHFFIVAFSAAPGATYMDQLAEAYNFGLTIPQIVEIFTTKPQFTQVYPEDLSNREFATLLAQNIVKSSATDLTIQSAIKDIEAALDIGWTRGKVIYTVFGNLVAKPTSDAIWGGTAQQFKNQLEVAAFLTEVMRYKTDDLALLRSVIEDVTNYSDVSTEAKIIELIGTLPPGV